MVKLKRGHTSLLAGLLVLSLLIGCDKQSDQEKSEDDHLIRGADYLEQGQYDKAVAELTQAIEANPGDPALYMGRSSAYFMQGLYDQAIADSTQVIQLNPQNAGAYYSRGVAYNEKGLYDKAITDYGKAIGIGPHISSSVCRKGKRIC